MKTVPDSSRTSLTPERWIDAATEVLADQGIDSVRVDSLARALKVTRGSFYWHFRDRDDLLRAVLQAWRTQATVQLTRRLKSARDDPRDQIRDLISLPFRGRAAARAARIELAIRAWARCDDMARAFVDEADAARIGYIAQVFSSLGFSISEARTRAFLLYSYELAESLLASQGTASQRTERAQLVERLIQLRLPK
jgi:AcrR family transcriptional regulator